MARRWPVRRSTDRARSRSAIDGTIYLALREGNAIHRITPRGTIHHLAGTGAQGYTGDGGPARLATLGGPKGLAISGRGLYVVDTENHAIRRIDLDTGIITTVLGTGTRGDGPDGDPRRCALARPHGVCAGARRRALRRRQRSAPHPGARGVTPHWRIAVTTPSTAIRIDTGFLHDHWQGHRRLTRRLIEAFPEDALFHFSLGGMRPFGAMAFELISMASAGIEGIATGDWRVERGLEHHVAGPAPRHPRGAPAAMGCHHRPHRALWPGIPPARFEAVDTAFGQYEGVIYGLLLYWIDNEIHHRGQGYVYLRALGIEPPPFWDRG